MKNKNLPKYWVVLHNGTPEFDNIVIKYLKNNYNADYAGLPDCYYGVIKIKGKPAPFCSTRLELFDDFVKLLTFQEFKDILKISCFKRGELVEVRDYNSQEWQRAIYLETIRGTHHPHMCVDNLEEEKYRRGEAVFTSGWEQIRKIDSSMEVKFYYRDYAYVYEDKVKIGDKEYPISIIDDLVAARDRLK